MLGWAGFMDGFGELGGGVGKDGGVCCNCCGVGRGLPSSKTGQTDISENASATNTMPASKNRNPPSMLLPIITLDPASLEVVQLYFLCACYRH